MMYEGVAGTHPLRYAEGGVVGKTLADYIRQINTAGRIHALQRWGDPGDTMRTYDLRKTLGIDPHEKVVIPKVDNPASDLVYPGITDIDPHLREANKLIDKHYQDYGPAEKKLFRFYQAGSDDINRAARLMHSGDPGDALEAQYILNENGLRPDSLQTMDAALQEYGLPESSTLWRGMRWRAASPNTGGMYRMGRDIPVGSTFGSKGYVSTSLDPWVSDNFSETRYRGPDDAGQRPVVFAIDAPAGQRGAFIRDPSLGSSGNVSREAEFLLPRGSEFETTAPPVILPRQRHALLIPMKVKQGSSDPSKWAGTLAGVGALGALSVGSDDAEADDSAPPSHGAGLDGDDVLHGYADGGEVGYRPTLEEMTGDATPYSTSMRPFPEAYDPYSSGLPRGFGVEQDWPVTYPDMIRKFGMRNANQYLKDQGTPMGESKMDFVLKAAPEDDYPELHKYFREHPRTPEPTGELNAYEPTLRDKVRGILSGSPRRVFQNAENSGMLNMVPGADILSILERRYRGEHVDPEEDFGAMLYGLPGVKLPMALGVGSGVGGPLLRDWLSPKHNDNIITGNDE